MALTLRTTDTGRVPTPIELRGLVATINAQASRAASLTGGHWTTPDAIPTAEKLLEEIAAGALAARAEIRRARRVGELPE